MLNDRVNFDKFGRVLKLIIFTVIRKVNEFFLLLPAFPVVEIKKNGMDGRRVFE
jgi:hypothetical protein